jgi:hypothetical protein
MGGANPTGVAVLKHVQRVVWWSGCAIFTLLSMSAPAKAVGPDVRKGTASVEGPERQVFESGACRVPGDGSFLGKWNRVSGATLSFALGQGYRGLSDLLPQSKPTYHGAGDYNGILITIEKSTSDSTFMKGTLTVDAGERSGRFDDGDGGLVIWNCGTHSKPAARRRAKEIR